MKHSEIPARNRAIKAAADSGVLVHKIADKYHLSINHVFAILNRSRKYADMVEVERPASDASVSRIRELAATGKTRREIAAVLDIHYNYLCTIARHNGIKIKHKPHEFARGTGRRGERRTPHRMPAVQIIGELARLTRMGAEFTFMTVAEKFGVSREFVGQANRAAIDAGLLPAPELEAAA